MLLNLSAAMKDIFEGALNLNGEFFSFVILPFLIFFARICEMTINTLRIIYVLGGRRFASAFLGFFESLVWLIAMRQIFAHFDNWLCYVAYPGGFAAGIFIGMMIEERIAYGKVIIRIITRKDVLPLLQFLNEKNFRFTSVDAKGPMGRENLVFTVIRREYLDILLFQLSKLLPSAFYTIENVRAAGEKHMTTAGGRRFDIVTWLRGIVKY